ncbi:hypothetical protein C7S18_21105 [Ahniella affigens]|uniref:Glycosyltransferase RgtA/B/C/D-like domain-containing protein n=1 Tax=Ahniella affigens TaxID=2021234 RepID=A0A2P1PXF2_9GAMM|nr:glycosyltransferase family 39 protein [Ahniella affigens]AVP99517.1 hypothetical protein C7S18_21105 [Ahniella affigens]
MEDVTTAAPTKAPQFVLLHSWKWLALILLVLGFAFQGSRGLWEPDEGRYTEVGMQMLKRGDFITPHRHHHRIHPTKPPMTYWAIAASVAMFGKSEWAVRLPYALAFVATGLLLFAAGRKLMPAYPALPALIYATMFLPMLATNLVTTDVFLTLFVTAGAIAYLVLGHTRLGVRLMWLGFGLAFLTKGPPALLPLAGLLIAHRWSGRPVRALIDAWGLIVFLVVAFTWYGLVVWRNPGLLSYFIHDEVVARTISDKHGRSPQWWGGFYVYGLTLLIGTLPFGLSLIHRWRESPLTRVGRQNLLSEDKLLWCWLLVPLVVFMLARSRLPLYLLPLFPAIALLIARNWQRQNLALPLRMVVLTLFASSLLALKGYAGYMPSHQDMRSLSAEIARKVPFAPHELAFVNTKPKYGLAYYLDIDAEWLDIGGNPSGEYDDSLASELYQNEGPRLYLLRPEKVDAFLAKAAELDQEVADFGATHGYRLFGLKNTVDQRLN